MTFAFRSESPPWGFSGLVCATRSSHGLPSLVRGGRKPFIHTLVLPSVKSIHVLPRNICSSAYWALILFQEPSNTLEILIHFILITTLLSRLPLLFPFYRQENWGTKRSSHTSRKWQSQDSNQRAQPQSLGVYPLHRWPPHFSKGCILKKLCGLVGKGFLGRVYFWAS